MQRTHSRTPHSHSALHSGIPDAAVLSIEKRDGNFPVTGRFPASNLLPRRAMTIPRPLLLVAALLALPACAAVTGNVPGRSALLSDAPMPPGRPCRVSPEPAELPSVDALVDSAALSAAAVQVWRGARAQRGHALFAMGFDREGLNVRRDLLEHRLPQEMADSLQKLVFAHRRTVAQAEHEWGVRLRMDVGEQPVLRVGRRELCPAQPRDRRVAGYGPFSGSTFGDVRDREATPGLPLPGSGTVWVRVMLDAAGNVTEARLERSLARPAWERSVLNYVRAISFVPATEDGWPVPAQLVFPLRLNN
jgi:TonB family protein